MAEELTEEQKKKIDESIARATNGGIRRIKNEESNIKKVYGIVSGKGGVGKSLTTSILATDSVKAGFQTAILDADITGPSIPKMFGVNEKAIGIGDNICPVETESGLKMMSINLLLDDTSAPVIWRGPVIAGAVTQFWKDCLWGDVDYMFVDMPPGTGDVPLTVFQSIPIDGIIVVTSPQELVEMIVAKAVKMADMMNIPVVGIVENMSYFECPDCGKKHYIFGESKIEETAKKFNIDTISRIPMNPEIARLADAGDIQSISPDYLNEIEAKIFAH